MSRRPYAASRGTRYSVRAARAAALLALPLSIAGCCDVGGGGGGGGVLPPGTTPTTAIDFELRTDIPLGAPLVADALVIDLNGDGVSDLVELGLTEQRLTIALATPSGPLLWQNLPTPGVPLRVVAADLAGDGAIALVVLCFLPGGDAPTSGNEQLLLPVGTSTGGATLAIYREADGEWFLESTATLDEPAYDMAAASLDGGPREHLIVPQRDAQEVWVLGETGGDLLPVAVLSAVGSDGTMGPFSVTVIEDDGLRDIAAGLYDADGAPLGSVVIFRQTAPLEFAAQAVLPVLAFLPIVRALPDVVPAQSGGGAARTADLAVADAHPFATVVQVFAGEDDFTGAPVLFANGGPSTSALAADFDGDGVLDLAFTLFDSAGVNVFLGDGLGGYGEPRLYNVGPAPRALQAFDLNDDGRADLAVATTGGTSVMLSLADGRMRAAEGFTVGPDLQLLQASDLDQDGFQDIVTIDLNQREVTFLRGLPERRFELAGSVSLAATDDVTPAYIEVADVTGDGFPDVLVSASQTGVVQLLRGGPTLPPAAPGPADTFAVGPTPRGLAVGDIDGDGELDALVAVGGLGALRTLRNDGGGAFSIGEPIDVPGEPLAVRLADLDNDGVLDAVVSNDAPAALVMRGDGNGGFELVGTYPLPAVCLTVRVGDLVVNGLPDVMLSQSGLDITDLVMLENVGDFAFVPSFVTVGVDPRSVELVDIDGDGVLDLLSPTGGGNLAVLANDGAGGFAPFPTLLGLALDVPWSTRASTMVDLDFDGRPDLLMLSTHTRQLWVSRNTSPGTTP